MAFKMKGTAFYGKSSQSPISQKQQGPINKENEDLLDGEHEDTYVYKGDKKSERINDYEDRAEFSRYDGNTKNAKKLQREADIIRDRDE